MSNPKLQFIIEQLLLFVFLEIVTILFYWNQVKPDCSFIDPIFYTVLGVYAFFVVIIQIWKKKGLWFSAKRNSIVSSFFITFPLLLNLYYQYQNPDTPLHLPLSLAMWFISVFLYSVFEYKRNFGKQS